MQKLVKTLKINKLFCLTGIIDIEKKVVKTLKINKLTRFIRLSLRLVLRIVFSLGSNAEYGVSRIHDVVGVVHRKSGLNHTKYIPHRFHR